MATIPSVCPAAGFDVSTLPGGNFGAAVNPLTPLSTGPILVKPHRRRSMTYKSVPSFVKRLVKRLVRHVRLRMVKDSSWKKLADPLV